jgi:outer membrane protein insertion porin family
MERFLHSGTLCALIALALAIGIGPTKLNAAAVAPTVQGANEQVIYGPPQIHGNRRIPTDTIRSRMQTKAGDIYDPAALERDFHSLWNTGYFSDIRIEREDTPKGVVIHVFVQEKPTIREINYVGLSSVSQSDVLERFKQRKVTVSMESQYDPTKVKRAEVALKELLGEHGRQFATVRTEVRPVPPNAVNVTFVVKEGPKVKVGRIKFVGNEHVPSRTLRAAMKNSKPIGIPHSIVLENLFSHTFDASKLSEDAERVRLAYQDRGYFKVIVNDPQTKIRDTGHTGFHIPLIMHGPGKVVDITVPVNEGDRYRLKAINFHGGKAITNYAQLRPMFAIKDGEIFNRSAVGKGLENLRKAYGEYGYINFTPVPTTNIDDEKKTITLDIDLDEGKQYRVRRIEFQGNTTTRDKVIRREIPLDEGQVYNSRYWELGLMRLNQLGYFDQLKPDDPATTDIHRNDQQGTVDLTLKVKEKGKNQIGLTGGISGLAGSFIGVNYETNNFLGLGETLRVSANVGNLSRNVLFSFTQPYLFDRPLQAGFSVYGSKFNYNEAKQYSILTGQKLNFSQSELATLQNYTQSSLGMTLSASYPIRHSFKRIGITYGWDRSSIQTFSTASQDLFQFLYFRQTQGPNALTGIVTSKIVPNLSVNTQDDYWAPHSGHAFFLSSEIAGLGGNTRYVRPAVDWKQFIPMKILKPLSGRNKNEGGQTFGYHIQAAFLSGYGGLVATPFQRFYMGGENDIRGFDIRSVSPVGFIADAVSVPLLNPDNTAVPSNPANPRAPAVGVPIPIYRIVFPGGDTSVVGNFEYSQPIIPRRAAIVGFVDIGFNGIARSSQLRLTPTQFNLLNSTSFGCPTLDFSTGCQGGTPMTFGQNLNILSSTNWQPRMSTGLELRVMMPIVNAPFRIYYALNPLRVNETISSPSFLKRSMFPVGAAGDYSFQQAQSLYAPAFVLQEPKKTFRFTVSTTF